MSERGHKPESSSTHATPAPKASAARVRAGSLLPNQAIAASAVRMSVMRDADSTQGAGPLHPAIAANIHRAIGGGRRLPDDTRGELEDHFGADLSSVRVHDDAEAAELSRSVQATAFTTGSDVFFSEGSYRPGTTEGRRLLAHEVTHTLQQPPNGDGGIVDPGDPSETEADRLANDFIATPPSPEATGVRRQVTANAGIQRKVSPKYGAIVKNLSYGFVDWAITDSEAHQVLDWLDPLDNRDLHDTLNQLDDSKKEYVDRLLENISGADAAAYEPLIERIHRLRRASESTERLVELLSYGLFDWAVTDAEAHEVLATLDSMSDGQRRIAVLQMGSKFTERLFDNITESDKKTYAGLITELEGYRNNEAVVSESERFGGDTKLEEVATGIAELRSGDSGMPVVKLQQSLVDLGYALPAHGVSGTFNSETEAAVLKFQKDQSIAETGELDAATIDALETGFDDRSAYLKHSTFDPAKPDEGTRTLTAAEKAAVKAGMVPARGTGGTPATFTKKIGGVEYGDRIEARLKSLISTLHTELFASKKDLRSDDANLHSWSALEGPAQAAKSVADDVYGSYITTTANMTHTGGVLIDQWVDELDVNSRLNDTQKKAKARGKVDYLIASNARDINNEHSAVPSDPQEEAILKPIIDSFVNTPAEVQKMLEIDIGWEGAQLEGEIYLQRFKKDTDEENRELMWELFHTSIHEYLHLVTAPALASYAEDFKRNGDEIRYNALTEGFNEFFAENVRSTVSITPELRKKVEGTYYRASSPAPAKALGLSELGGIGIGLYGSREQAEQIVALVGIHNAQSAYFRGEVDKLGGP